MPNVNCKGSRTFRAQAALGAMIVMGLGLMAPSAKAAPFAYVTTPSGVTVIDTATNTVVAMVPMAAGAVAVAVAPDGKRVYAPPSVIDTSTNTVVATVPSGGAVAVAPDGKRVYVTGTSNGVAVIDTTTDTVVATVPVTGDAVAVAPDGKHVYVTVTTTSNCTTFPGCGGVAVIDVAINTVVATVALPATDGPPNGIAITLDGKHVYVTSHFPCCTYVIDTSTNTLVATVGVGRYPNALAILPDGKHVYVTNTGFSPAGSVSVIDTASNTVATITLPLYSLPYGVAVTPDGKHAYVTNVGPSFSGPGNVSVIDTITNTIITTIAPAGAGAAFRVGIIPDIPFGTFNAAKLAIKFGKKPFHDSLKLESSFTLGTASSGINPVIEPVTLQVGTFATTIPPGSFRGSGFGPFTFHGVINGVALDVVIKPTGAKRYALVAAAQNATLSGKSNSVTVRVSIGIDSGTISVNAI